MLVLPDNNHDPDLTQILRNAQEMYRFVKPENEQRSESDLLT